MSNSFYQIEKLDGANYESWKIQMRSVLIHSGLWGYVSGTIAPPETTKVEESKKHKLQDEKALASIFLGLKPDQLIHIKKCTVAKEAWEKLEEVYQSKGPARKTSLFKKLINLKMASASDMRSHLNEFFEIHNSLIEADITLPEELSVIILLSSLPAEFENFVIAIESRDELPKVENLKNKLLEEGIRREGNSKEAEQSAFALKGQKEKKFTKSENEKSKNQRGFASDRRCYNCGKPGHFSRFCRAPKNSNSDGPKKQVSFCIQTFPNDSLCNLNYHFSSIQLKSKIWIFDSGCTSHICCEKSLFSSISEHEEKIELPDRNCLKSSGIGEVNFRTSYGEITLKSVLFVPQLNTNFISISKATANGLFTVFSKNFGTIKNYNNEKLLVAKQVGGLFVYEMEEQKLNAIGMKQRENFELWHKRFGHLNARSLSEMNRKNMVRGMELQANIEKIDCEVCLRGKISTLPFQNSSSKCTDILEIVVSDICGPMKVTSLGGNRYFATFIDLYTRRNFVYFLKNKSDIFECFRKFKAMVENQTGKRLKIFRSDNGTEYLSNQFKQYLEENGIEHQLTVQYTPQQNGIAERANRTLVEMARCLLMSSGLPDYLWPEAINTAVYLRNRSATSALDDITPYEKWFSKKPSVKHLKIFGCKAVMLDKKPGRSKLKPKGLDCYMVGYSSESKAYRVYIPDQRVVTKTRDIRFLENSTKADSVEIEIYEEVPRNEEEVPRNEEEEVESDDEENFEDAEDTEIIVVSDESPPKVNKGGRPKIIRTGKRGRPRKVSSSVNFIESESQNYEENPKTVKEALEGNSSRKWIASMREEFNNLLKNKTWELVELPKNRKALKAKWVFNIKRDKNGAVERYKSRLVAKGCSQKAGIDYKETFSPVVRYSSIRILLALAAELKLEIHQMDVVSAYLNGELKDEIYMEQPEQFIDPDSPHKVCKLKKGLYGLKQAGREWNQKLDSVLKQLGFIQSKQEVCIYILKRKNGEFVILAVFVDDMLLFGSNLSIINEIKHKISLELEVVDKGPAEYFLGMEIQVNKSTGEVSIQQKQFIQSLLEDYRMENCRKTSTPLDPGQKFEKCDNCSEKNCEKIDPKKYQSLIGSLLYLSISTRPDISYAVNKLSQFNVNPHSEHWSAAKHILRYLSSTRNMKLTYRKTTKKLEGYADADWAGNCDRKSQSGYSFILANSAVVWETHKQKSVALSSTEAEYVALSNASKEAVYLKNLLTDIGFEGYVADQIKLFGDNLSAIQLVKNPVYHARSKHIDIRVHYVREVYNNNVIQLEYCSTNDNIADIFTKSLCKQKHHQLSKSLGMTEMQI